MNQIISNFKKIIVHKNGSVDKSLLIKNKEKIISNALLLRGGLYDGDILGCIAYKHTSKDIVLDCYKFKLFDILLNRIDPDFFPQMVNVNALLEFKDKKGENYLMFLKREKEVYAYSEYWDFPAGLIPYDVSLLDRMKDRLIQDLGPDFANISIPKEPSFIVSRGIFLGLYYRIKSPYTIEEAKDILYKLEKEKRLAFVKFSEVEKFMKTTKKMFPILLEEIYSSNPKGLNSAAN
jgi:hypothetical protein